MPGKHHLRGFKIAKKIGSPLRGSWTMLRIVVGSNPPPPWKKARSAPAPEIHKRKKRRYPKLEKKRKKLVFRTDVFVRALYTTNVKKIVRQFGIPALKYRKDTSIRQAPVFRHLRALRKKPWKFIIWMNEL